ncbi:MAG TPA: winged helix-turn-helix domain-containing protein [Candidatus Bathyarchaeia archaeon]|nr:winged helix-turn-helix domain-containing protein [Candidatus Bathyarchaeia archaeon]
MAKLLENAGTAHDRFLVLLAMDIEDKAIDLSSLDLSDVDGPSKSLRIKRDIDQTKRVKLRDATVIAFHQYASGRTDHQQELFVDPEGKKQSKDDLITILGQIADQSSLRFDPTTLHFDKPAKEQAPRIATKTASKDMFYLYGIVSHPLRRKIVEILGEGPTSFTVLKKRVDVKVGTLYYHLDMLKGLITQDEQKRYQLTTVGTDAYTKLQSREYVDSTMRAQEIPGQKRRLDQLGNMLSLGPVWPWLASNYVVPKIGALALAALGAIIVYQARLETVLLFLNTVPTATTLLPLEYILSWIAVFGIADLGSTILYRRKGEHIALFLATGYTLIPIIGFALWWSFQLNGSFPNPPVSILLLSRSILIVLQAWSLGMLARAVSTIKGLRLERAAVVIMAVAYASILVAYLRGV